MFSNQLVLDGFDIAACNTLYTARIRQAAKLVGKLHLHASIEDAATHEPCVYVHDT